MAILGLLLYVIELTAKMSMKLRVTDCWFRVNDAGVEKAFS